MLHDEVVDSVRNDGTVNYLVGKQIREMAKRLKDFCSEEKG